VGKELICFGVSNHYKSYNFTKTEHSEVNALRKFVKNKKKRKHVTIINFCFVDGKLHKSEECCWCGYMMDIYATQYKFKIKNIIYYDGKQWLKKRKNGINLSYKTSGARG
jgi:hypothetical protein